MRPVSSALRTLVGVALSSALASCGPATPPQRRVDRGAGPSAATDPLGASLHHDIVEHAGLMEEVGTTSKGTLAADGTADRSLILQAGYCFVVFVRTDPSAGELHLRIVDSNGDPRQLDADEGPAASLGLQHPICPEPTTEYRLELRSEHPGNYAMRLFRTLAL